ncbi:Acyl-coenzyme A thioesterase 13 [Mortierella sp. GBA30]|nr:Acyl-coenzyme A thioesterase 13 [Mortierella sp. GBA30]
MKNMHKFANRADEDGPGFVPDCFGRAQVVEADDDSAVFEYTVQKSDCNFSNSFHGGAIATLVDNLSTAAMFTRERKHFLYGGVSSDLHVTYVSAAALGMTVLLEVKVHKVGAGLANTTTVMKDKATGRVLATATHTKFNTDSRMGGSKL